MTIITVSADVAAQAAESLLQANAERLVQREVQLCLSSMVAALANGADRISRHRVAEDDLATLADQAQELCYANTDWEEAAREAGWTYCAKSDAWTHNDHEDYAATAEEACEMAGVDEPYHWEVFEHWAVSSWLAEKLQAAGERVDTDFAGLNVWARTTTGQAISMDSVIREITAEIHAERGVI